MFKIISTGWNCARFAERTLRSVEEQARDDWEILCVDDATPDASLTNLLKAWCGPRDDRWNYRVNARQQHAVRNQVEGIRWLDPGPDDVIIWLDLDGDRFAHPYVLDRLAEAYADGTLLTYGSFEPDPKGPYEKPTPFPADVVRRRTWRDEIRWKHHHFNHLRTMRGRVFHAIPDEHYHWPDGRWYDHGCDYIMMTAGLELADGRYKCLDETLMYYNAANPHADNRRHPAESSKCVTDYLARPPLAPLAVVEKYGPPRDADYIGRQVEQERASGFSFPYTPVRTPNGDPFLPQPQRVEILRGIAREHRPRYFVETGTLAGDTPAALAREFERLYTIELSIDFHSRAAARLSKYPNVTCLFGDSGKVLPDVLAGLDGPALLWLDGHYCGGDSARGDVDTPAAAELDAALASEHRHWIVLDDARLYGGMAHHTDEFADYPHVEWIADRARAAGYTIEIRDDMIRVFPA